MIEPSKLKTFLGLKWNPFLPDVPASSLCEDEQVSLFCWRVEQLVMDGGYSMISGEPGVGKSVVLRQLKSRLEVIPEISARTVTRPQNGLRDFYRELASLYSLELQTGNRYGSFRRLREQWLSQIQSHLFRPVLIIDEAQSVPIEVLSELRILGSTELDARCILAVVFAGDGQFLKNLQCSALLPLESRIRTCLRLGKRDSEFLKRMLVKAMTDAGNPELMTSGVINALSEHCLGNPRAVMIAAGELLSHAVYMEKKQINEDLYLEVFKRKSKKKK